MSRNGEEWRFVLMRNMELDPNIPQTFQIRAREPVTSLLTQWATKNELSASEFAFFTGSGRSIEECRFISDLPLLAPGLNYVDIKCVKTKSTVFQVYGYSDYRTNVKITLSSTLEELENQIRDAIPCIRKRTFRLLTETFNPLSRTMSILEQLRGESLICWIDLEHSIKCLDLKLGKIIMFKLNGADSVTCLLCPDSPKSQNLIYFDEKHKTVVIDEKLNIAELAIGEITEPEFSVLRVTQQTVLVDDPCEESLELFAVNVWPTDEVQTLSSHLPRKRRIRHGEVSHIYCDGKRLDPTMLFCEISDSNGSPILHLSKKIEIHYCDQSSEIHSVFLDSSATVLELRTSIMNKFKRCNDEIVLKYNGLLLDSDDAVLYEFNIRDRSLVHVYYARLCLLVNKSKKRTILGYHHELNYFFVYKLACQFLEKSLSLNTVFVCKCGRQLSFAEDQRNLSVDCCRPRHRRMVLTAHCNITVRFHLFQDTEIFRVTARTDETLASVAERLMQTFPVFLSNDARLLKDDGKARDDMNMTLYQIQQDDSDSLVVPFEKKVTLLLDVKRRTFNWTIWPSDFVSTVMEDVNTMIKDMNCRTVEYWMYRQRKITEPKHREYLEFLRFRHFGICERQNFLVAESKSLKKKKHPTSKQVLAAIAPPRPPVSHPNITVAIGDREFEFEVWESDSAASLCARLCIEKKMWNGSWVEPPNATRIHPYEKKWWNAPLLGSGFKPDLKKKLYVGEAAMIRFIVIAICPVGNPVSFFVKSSKVTMDAVKVELEHRGLYKGGETCWFTQVGRYFKIDEKQYHGVATVIGNSPNTCFISDKGESSPKHFSGSVTISNISGTLTEPSLTVPPFGDPKIEIYVKTVYLRASPSLSQPPQEVGTMEKCFTPDVFVYFRGVCLGSKNVLCPSLHSGRSVNSNTGFLVTARDGEGGAKNFVLVFDERGVVPKFKIPVSDEIRVFYRAGYEVTFRDGQFVGKVNKGQGQVEDRWIADDRSKDLTKSVGRYLRGK